jgi:hypothetical protein
VGNAQPIAANAPPVYKPANHWSIPSPPQPRGSRSCVVQPVIKFNGKEYSSREQVGTLDGYEELIGNDPQKTFDAGPAVWKRRGIKHAQTAAKKTWMNARLKSLDALLADKEIHQVPPGKTLMDLINERVRENNDIATQLKKLKSGKTEVDLTSPYKNESVRALVTELSQSGIVFPLDELEDVAKKADRGERGFQFELEIAVRAVRSSAVKRRTTRIQLGKLSLSVIEGYLKGSIAKYDNKLKPGGVGADVVIWTQDEDGKWSGKFIQAKSVQPDNIAENVAAAKSQLEGNCADPKAAHTAQDREQTLVGGAHKGKIMVETLNLPDSGKMKTASESALSSPHVKIVSFRDALGKQGKERFPARVTQPPAQTTV